MKKFFNEAKGHMMTGIGYMLPLIIGASLVVAIPLIIALCTGVQSLDPYAKATGFYHTLWHSARKIPPLIRDLPAPKQSLLKMGKPP